MMPSWIILDIFNIQSNLENLKSGTRDFILKYREFELAYREKNIKIYTLKMIIISVFPYQTNILVSFTQF